MWPTSTSGCTRTAWTEGSAGQGGGAGFRQNSTRTRTSLQVGIYQMGGLGTYLSAGDLQTARGEPVQDTARVLGRYYDAMSAAPQADDAGLLAKYSGIPVISGMTDYAHPAGADRPDDRARAQARWPG
ncbi:MAG: hypothetical protein ACLURG_08610 [Gemmiger sp.]